MFKTLKLEMKCLLSRELRLKCYTASCPVFLTQTKPMAQMEFPLVFKRDSLPIKFQRFLLISINTVSISELCLANENKQRICHSQERKEIGFIKL